MKKFIRFTILAVLLISMSALAMTGCKKRTAVDRTPDTDSRTVAYKTYQANDTEIKGYASLYQAIDDLMASGDQGDYIKHVADGNVVYVNSPDATTDIFYFFNESSFMKKGPWSAAFSADIQANPKTHTVNAKDGTLNYASYAIASNKGVKTAAAWMFSKASPANVEIQPLLYSGIQKSTITAELTKAKVSPSYNKDQKTYARVGFLSQQGYVVGDLGVTCDTATGNWYLYTGTRSMEDDSITLGELVMGSTWNDTTKEFTPDDDVIITVEQIVNVNDAHVNLSVSTVNGKKTFTAKFEHEKLEAVGTLAINASLNPNITTKGRATYDIMNGSYIKNLRISEAKGFVKSGLADIDYDGNIPVLSEGEHKLYTLSDANSYTVIYNDDNSSHSVEGEVDIINLDFSKSATTALSLIPISKVEKVIEALPEPDDISTQNNTAVTDARAEFNKLSSEQQALISNSIKTKLEKCEQAIQNITGKYTIYSEANQVLGASYNLFAAIDEIYTEKYTNAYIKVGDETVFSSKMVEGKNLYIFDKNYNTIAYEAWTKDGSDTNYAKTYFTEGNSVIKTANADGSLTGVGTYNRRSFVPALSKQSDVSTITNAWGAYRFRINERRLTLAQANSWTEISYQHKSMKQVYELSKSVIKPSNNPNQPAIAMLYFGYANSTAGKIDIGIYLDSSKVNAEGKAEWKFMTAKVGEPFVFTDIVVMTATKNSNGEFVTDYDLQFDTTFVYGAESALKLKVTPIDSAKTLLTNKAVEHQYLTGTPITDSKSYAYGVSFTPDTWTNNRVVGDLTNGGYFKNVILTESSVLNAEDVIQDMMFGNELGHQQCSYSYGAPNVSVTHTGSTNPVTFNFDYSMKIGKKAQLIGDKDVFTAALKTLALTQAKIAEITLTDAKITDYRATVADYVSLAFEARVLMDTDDSLIIKSLIAKLNSLDNIDKAKAAITALVNPESITSKDSEAIAAANDMFNKLTVDEKAAISTELKDKLALCVNTIENLTPKYTIYNLSNEVMGASYNLFSAIDDIITDKMTDCYIKDDSNTVVFDFKVKDNKAFFIIDEKYDLVAYEGWSADGSETNYYKTFVKEGYTVLKIGGTSGVGNYDRRSFVPALSKQSDATTVSTAFGPYRNRINYSRLTLAQAHTWADSSYYHKSMKQVYELSKSVIKPSNNPNQPAIAMLYFGYAYSSLGKVDVGIYLDSSKVNAEGKAEWKFMTAKVGEPFVFTDEVVMTATKNSNGEFVTDFDMQFDTTYVYGAAPSIKLKVTPISSEGALLTDKSAEHEYSLGTAELTAERAYTYGVAFTPDTWTNNRVVGDLTNGGYFKNIILKESTIIDKDDTTRDMMFDNDDGHQRCSLTYGAPNVSFIGTGSTNPVTFNFDYSMKIGKELQYTTDKAEFKTIFDTWALTEEKIAQITLTDAKIADYRSYLTEYNKVATEVKRILDSGDVALINSLKAKINFLDFMKEFDILILTQADIDALTLENAKIADYRSIATKYTALSTIAKGLLTTENVTLLNNLITKLAVLDTPVI